MNKLKVGYGRVNIDPPLGIGITGYYVPRYAKGFLDSLEASALALECDGKQMVIISIDHLGIGGQLLDTYRDKIANECGIDRNELYIACTHTHTGPFLQGRFGFDVEQDKVCWYADFMGKRLVDVVKLALSDIKPARMGFIVGYAPERVAYIRRYKMKDGSTWTCPPINDPNIDYPLGELDQRVNVLRFDQENGETIVIMNYGVHADTIGGELLSADWPAWTRKTVDAALGAKCMCIVGAQGDVGSTHVNPCGGDMNDTEISFDNEMKSPGMARFVGRALAGTILQVYDKVEYIDVDRINILHKIVRVDANTPDPEDLPLAHKYKELHDAGRDDEIPYTAMELTTVVAEATRMCALENGPEYYDLEMTGLQIGDVALIGIPGEPFTDIGVQIKDTEGWSAILPTCITNGSMGYFPTMSAYKEGGYESRSSHFRAGVAEKLIAGGKELLAELKK